MFNEHISSTVKVVGNKYYHWLIKACPTGQQEALRESLSLYQFMHSYMYNKTLPNKPV